MNEIVAGLLISFGLMGLGSLFAILIAGDARKKTKEQKMNDQDLNATDFVKVEIEEMKPLPPGSNSLRFDLTSMCTPVVRGWEVLHDGFDNEEYPWPLKGMYLHNTRTGQRIRLKFSKSSESPLVEYRIGHPVYSGVNKLCVTKGKEATLDELKRRGVSEEDAEQGFKNASQGEYVTLSGLNDQIVELIMN